MLPVIFKFGPFTLHSFGLMLFLGFVVGLFVVWKKAREEHYEEEDILDVVLISSFWALVSSRVVYVLLHLDQFGINVLAYLNIIGKPGFALIGGLLGGLLAMFWQSKKRKWDFFEFADFSVMGLSLTMVFGWIGSFLNGSSFGLPTESIVGIRFIGMFDKRHPVQLYAALLYLLLFVYLVWVEGKYRTFEWYRAGKSGVKSGFLTYNFLVFIGIFGIVISLYSPPVFLFGGINFDYLIWLLFLISGSVGLYIRSGREISKDIKSVSRTGKRRERIDKKRLKSRRDAFKMESDIL